MIRKKFKAFLKEGFFDGDREYYKLILRQGCGLDQQERRNKNSNIPL